MSQPYLVGECPSQRGDRYHMFPLSGPPARVLCKLAGISPDPGGSTYGKWTWPLYEHFECVNLIPRHAPLWPAEDAAAVADAMDLGGRPLIMLGRRVATAFGWPSNAAWGIWGLVRSSDAVMLPHPSGLNRLLNETEMRETCRRVLREAIEEAKEWEAL